MQLKFSTGLKKCQRVTMIIVIIVARFFSLSRSLASSYTVVKKQVTFLFLFFKYQTLSFFHFRNTLVEKHTKEKDLD